MTRLRPRHAIAMLAACAALISTAGTAGAGPTATERSLGLQGASNARDIGGYRTTDGHIVRSGLVFRSNALDKLTAADLANLEGRHTQVIEDLRTVFERTIQPDRVPAGATDRWRDVLGQAPITTVLSPPSAYPAFISAPGASQQFAAVLHDIQNTKGAVLYHCSAGKDRTGWTTAVLLTILGVPRNTVADDYLLSNTYLHAAPGDTLNGVTLDELNTAFATATQQYGSFDNYVRNGLGVSDRDIAALKAKLLA